MRVEVILPIVVRSDNIAAIFMAKNSISGEPTHHIETRYYFVQEYVEDVLIKIVFVKTEDNSVDIFTKILETKHLINM
jgi:hypothetical protein